jgi:hypothetical protein
VRAGKLRSGKDDFRALWQETSALAHWRMKVRDPSSLAAQSDRPA